MCASVWHALLLSINGQHLIQVAWLGQCGWGIDALAVSFSRGDPALLISYAGAMTKLS